jgi:hypothetical protein
MSGHAAMSQMEPIGEAPTFRAPIVIPAGKTMRFRYAVITFLGQADGVNLGRIYGDWTK